MVASNVLHIRLWLQHRFRPLFGVTRNRPQLVLIVLLTSIIMFVSPTFAQVVNIVDASWMKTLNTTQEDRNFLGMTAYPPTDPFWTWTTMVWDGPAQNGFGQPIPNYVPNDRWAYWVHTGGAGIANNRWFTTTLEVCDRTLLSEVRLNNKYCPSCP